MRNMRVLWVCLLAMSGGCATRPPWPDPESAASIATQTRGAIEVTVEAGTVDVQTPVGDQLQLHQAVHEALLHSTTVQIALAQVRVAQANAHQSRLLPNPIVSVVFRWPDTGGSPIIEAGLAAELLSLLKKPGEIKASDNRLRASSAEAIAVVLDVLSQVQSRYAEVQALDALVPVLEERVRLLERMTAIAESRLRTGEGTRLDVTTLQTQAVELQVEIIEREQERRDARLVLARLIGRPSDTAGWRVEPWSPPPVTESLPGEHEWIAAALTHRPEIQAIQWELLALGAEARLTGWGWLEGDEVGVDAEREDGWSVGPSLSVPIPVFDWGQARREEAQAKQSEAMHRLTEASRQVIEDVRRAHASHAASYRALVQVRDRLMPLLERRQQESESAYRAGQSDVIVLILAQQDLQAGRARLIELERKTSESLIRLHRAVGGPGHSPSPQRQDADNTSPAQENVQ